MSYTTMTFEIEDGVGVIRLNRPEEGNALTLELARELLDVAIRCGETPEVRAVLLTGNGRMFCAGGDLKAFSSQGEKLSSYTKAVTHALHAAISRFNWMDPPMVCAVNGAAGGGGLSLALTSDIALAGESAKFAIAYTKAGLAPDMGSTFFLSRIVGYRRAKEMLLLNPVLSAGEALEWGLVNRVVPDGELFQAAMEIARKWAAGPTIAFGEARRLLLAGAWGSLESQMERETRAVSVTVKSADGIEGIEAFVGKRAPLYRGG